MRATLSIIAQADLCGDLLPHGEDGEILEEGAEAAWDWLSSRATIGTADQVLVELPTKDLVDAWRRGAMADRETIEQRFMDGWRPTREIRAALEELIETGVGQVLVCRDY